jgi:type I restriction enzyme S subunit
MVMSDIPNGKAIAKCYYFEKGDYFSLNQRICSIKSETEVNKFLFYRINRHKYYLKFDNGVGQTNLRKSEVLNCPIKLPSLQEQQKIADFLTAVDKRIELLVKKKTLLETYKKGVMKKIFNQEIRFKDDSGSDFPDWEECKMGEIIDILSDYTANGSFGGLKENVQYYTEINFAALVRTTDLEKKLFNPQRFTDKRGYDYLSKTSLFGGEIIMANVGSIGKIYRCPESSFPMTLAPNTYMIKFKKKLINEGFIFQLMKRKTFKNKLLSMVGSSTLKAINKKNLRSIKVNIPSMEEQDKLNNFLFSIDTQLKLLESQIDKSKTWKKGLLQKMFV